jgi:hypothetical protein
MVKQVSGIVGDNRGAILNTYSNGDITGSGSVGGLVGENYNGTIANCFWDTQKTGQSQGYTLDSNRPGIITDVLGLTTVEMQDSAAFIDAGWDYVNETENGNMDLWYQPADSYPMLYWQPTDLLPINNAGPRAAAGLSFFPVVRVAVQMHYRQDHYHVRFNSKKHGERECSGQTPLDICIDGGVKFRRDLNPVHTILYCG